MRGEGRPGAQDRLRAAIAALVLFALIMAGFWAASIRMRETNAERVRARLTTQMSVNAHTLSSAVSSRFALLSGLHEFVTVSLPEGPSRAEFDIFASGLYSGSQGIRAIQVAPKGIVSLVYPLEGNVTGNNLLTDARPEVADDVRRTLASSWIVISGPYELKQGGLGLVGRQQVRTPQGEFWGFTIIVLDVPPVLEEAGLSEAPPGTRFALRDDHGRVFAGEAQVFDDSPVTFPIALPDGEWTLAAVPAAGWEDASRDGLPLLWGTGVVIAVLLSALLYTGLTYQSRLRAEIDRQTRMLTEQRDLVAAVAETSPIGILVVDASSGAVTFANAAAERVLGVDRADIIGRTYDDPRWGVERGEGGPLPVQELAAARVIATGAAVHDIRHPIELPDGTRGLLSVNAGPITSPDGSPTAVVITVVDITEEYREHEELVRHRDRLESLVEERTRDLAAANEELDATNEELQAANAELEVSLSELERLNAELVKASNAKNEFLASMSHELRTPLNSVIGFSDLMLSGMVGKLTPEQLKQIGMINSSGKHLLDLINGVLDLSKIEAGQLKLDSVPVDVHRLVLGTVATLGPLAEAKGLVLSAEVDDECGTVVSDETRLRQVLINLAGNAIKFTDEGSVTVRAKCVSDELVIDVIDTGRGISAVDLPRIFDEFYRGADAVASSAEGTGLGLAVSRGFIEQLGGRIAVTSTPGEGSTFSIHLPLVRP
ncbi:MAG: PAS domain-containing protein [Actinomycetia bacterium]|nr:PAS domain-containing protein [Actinomycetes bacterium]